MGGLIDATSPTTAFTILGVTGCVLSGGLLLFRRHLAAPRPLPDGT